MNFIAHQLLSIDSQIVLCFNNVLYGKDTMAYAHVSLLFLLFEKDP